jgi:hypothetical protein
MMDKTVQAATVVTAEPVAQAAEAVTVEPEEMADQEPKL